MKAICSYVLAGSAVLLCGVDTAYAQRQAPVFGVSRHAPQTINFTFGGFVPRGEDARVDGDVLAFNQTFLSFDMDEFKGPMFGVEYLLPIGKYIEVGAGLSFPFSRTAPSVYTDFVADDNSEIRQDLKLELQWPIEFTARVLPLGQFLPIQPYVGGGVGIYNWRYAESGEFIDFDSPDPRPPIFPASYQDKGTASGPIFLAGVRYAADAWAAGFEVRYRKAEGDLDPVQFLPPKIDLGGWRYLGTIGVRFD